MTDPTARPVPAEIGEAASLAGLDPAAVLDRLGAVWSPDFDAYASGELDISRVRCALCRIAPCQCQRCELRHVSYLGDESVCGMTLISGECPRGSAADHLPPALRTPPDTLTGAEQLALPEGCRCSYAQSARDGLWHLITRQHCTMHRTAAGQ